MDQPSNTMKCAMFQGLPQSENKTFLVSEWLIYRINLIPDLLIPFYPTLRTTAEQRPAACLGFVCFSKFWGEKFYWNCSCPFGQDSHLCSPSYPLRNTLLGIIPSLPFISSLSLIHWVLSSIPPYDISLFTKKQLLSLLVPKATISCLSHPSPAHFFSE